VKSFEFAGLLLGTLRFLSYNEMVIKIVITSRASVKHCNEDVNHEIGHVILIHVLVYDQCGLDCDL